MSSKEGNVAINKVCESTTCLAISMVQLRGFVVVVIIVPKDMMTSKRAEKVIELGQRTTWGLTPKVRRPEATV